jgi:ribonuclease D
LVVLLSHFSDKIPSYKTPTTKDRCYWVIVHGIQDSYMKIHKIQGDISSEVARSFKDSIAIDTEATGLLIPERDKLSLVQICSDGGDAYVVQPDRTNYKMPNLVSVLENDKIQKIGHFLRFDKSALEYFLKCKIKNIFCTKIASKICRTYTDSHGLKNLVQEFCNKKLDKNQGSSDWNKNINDLNDKQLEYAANDVIYLHKIKNELEKMLIREERMDIYKKCIEFLDTRIELDQKGFKFSIFEH